MTVPRARKRLMASATAYMRLAAKAERAGRSRDAEHYRKLSDRQRQSALRAKSTSKGVVMTNAPTNIPLNRAMSNGAKVSDWLGTAGVAAGYAATLIRRARDEDQSDQLVNILAARVQLGQALNELDEILSS